MKQEKHVISIIGGGSFGTVLADIAAHNNHQVFLWMRNNNVINDINTRNENTQYLPGHSIHPNVKATNNLEQAVQSSSIVLVSVPSKSFRELAYRLRSAVTEDQIIVSTTKGIEVGSFKLMSDILEEELCSEYIGVLSGPNIAKEVASHQLTASVIASHSDEVRATIRTAFSNNYFRVYENTDVFGVELAGALKNIYAIISGVAAALGAGENTKSMLITRGLAEMSALGAHLGANPLTFLGLAGVGDLIATCISPHSRNYRVGYAIGEGQSLEDIIANLGQVAEGVNTLRLVKQKANHLKIDMPLVNGIYSVLFEDKSVKDAMKELMLETQHFNDVDFIIS